MIMKSAGCFKKEFLTGSFQVEEFIYFYINALVFFPLVVVTHDQFAANTAKVRKIHDILLKLASKYQQIFLEKVIELHGSS